MKSNRLIVGLIALVVLGGGWYAFRPERLFVNQKVNESLTTEPASALPTGAMTAAEQATPNMTANESMMASETKTLVSGTFHSGAHETKGTATVYQLADGKRVLRFTDFMTSNGPDVQVYLVAAADAKDNDTVTKSGFVHLAALKGNIGDQNYELPSDLDLAKYRAVTIWCRRFGVNFGTAPLHS